MELFGFKFGKKKSEVTQEELKQKRSFVVPEADDGAITYEAAGGIYGQFIDFDGNSRTDHDLINRYRQMAAHPEVEGAIEDIVCESIVTEDNKAPVKIVVDEIPFSDSIKKKITAEFDTVLELLEFKTRGYEIFRNWYIDSRLAYHIITADNKTSKEGILELRYIDPVNLRKIKQYKTKNQPDGTKVIEGVEEFYVYNRDAFKAGSKEGIKVSPDAIMYVTSGLFDRIGKRIVGYLNKAIKPLNQLRMMEDALVIYRISRAPERRIFYVDVGNLPKIKADQYVRDLMNRYRNKLMYDATTGEIRDDRRHLSMLEDYWLPRREGSKGTEIKTLEGAQNLSDMEDVKYFEKKLFKSLNVPYSRLNPEEKTFNIGNNGEITRDEIKFSKFISRLRNKFSEMFLSLLRTQLILKGIVTADDWEKIKDKVFFDYLKDSYFTELKNLEIHNARMEALNLLSMYVGEGGYYSRKWVKTNILCQTEEEQDQIKQEMEEEKAEGLPAPGMGGMPMPGNPDMGGGMDPSMGGMPPPGGPQAPGGPPGPGGPPPAAGPAAGPPSSPPKPRL
jgi:hypothetical protein